MVRAEEEDVKEGAERAIPKHDGGEENGEEEENDAQPDGQLTTPKKKTRRTKADRPPATSKPKRRSPVDDAFPERGESSRRPKTPTRPKSRASTHVAAAPQESQQRPHGAPQGPYAFYPGFRPGPGMFPANRYGPPPHPVTPHANQARPFPPERFCPPTVGRYGWDPGPYPWHPYGQQISAAQPYLVPLGPPRQPRNIPLSPLERENNELRKALADIKAEQQRQEKERERQEKARAKAARRAAEREVIRKKAFEELRPFMDQYLQMLWREKNVLAAEESGWDPRRVQERWTGYDARDMQPLPRGTPHHLSLEREDGLHPTMEEFTQFLESKRILEGHWPYKRSTNNSSLEGSSGRGSDLTQKASYNPMGDPTFHNQMADMMPRILQQMQQGTSSDDWRSPPRSQNIAAQAADLNQQIFESWREHNDSTLQDRSSSVRTPKPQKARNDSGYASAANAAASNTDRTRKKKGSKGRRKSFTRQHRDIPDEELYLEDVQAEEEAEFEMIPGRKPAPYGFSGVFAPEPPKSMYFTEAWGL